MKKKRLKKEIDIMENEWHPFDKENPGDSLRNHCFYLVAHRRYGTPMKAKWHDEMGGYWQVFGCAKQELEYWYAWDEDHPIYAWMYLPKLPEEKVTTRRNEHEMEA